MTAIFIVALLGILVSAALAWLLRGEIRPRSLSSASKVALGGTVAAFPILALLSGMILFQESTGQSTGLSGGVASDARQWIKNHQDSPPMPDQEGDNIKLLRDGRLFFSKHTAAIPPDAAAALSKYSGLPDTPRSLLSTQQKAQYFEAATTIWQTINGLAQAP